jgi:hypothetical protein
MGLVEVIGRDGESDFGEFDRGPGAPAGKGDERVYDGDGVCVGHTHNVFIVEIVGKNAGIGMQVGEVSVIKVVTKRAVVHSKVEPFEPPAYFLVVIDVVFGSTAMALSLPSYQKNGFVKDRAVGLDPASDVGAGGAINRAEAAQFPEILRKLWDFR